LPWAAIGCVKRYADVVKRNFRVKKVVLYGSYLRDAAREDSDIDVAVVLERVDDDFLSPPLRCQGYGGAVLFFIPEI